jgi:hypothetical protein
MVVAYGLALRDDAVFTMCAPVDYEVEARAQVVLSNLERQGSEGHLQKNPDSSNDLAC